MKLKMKKTASLLLAAVTAFSMLPMAASAAATEKERNNETTEESVMTAFEQKNEVVIDEPGGVVFTDVPLGSYYYHAVYWARNNKLTGGAGQNKLFKPDETITRADMIMFLWVLAGRPEGYEAQGAVFNDVKKKDYFCNAVGWAVAHGITGGTGNNNFSPKRTIKNNEAIMFTYKAVQNGQINGVKSTRAGKIAKLNAKSWYKEALVWANNQQYLASIPAYGAKGEFYPEDETTRGMAIYLLWELKTGNHNPDAVRVEKMVQFAEGEHRKQYGENNEYAIGNEWCAAFATWAAFKAGLAASSTSATNVTSYPVLRSNVCDDMIKHFNSNGRMFVTNSNYSTDCDWSYNNECYGARVCGSGFLPSRGDIIFFSGAKTSPNDHRVKHVGIVTNVNQNGNTVTIETIEGNVIFTRGFESKYVSYKEYTYNVNDKMTITSSSDGWFKYIVGYGRIY